MSNQQKQAFEILSKRIVDEADVARLDSFLQGKDIKEYTSNPCMNEDFVTFELAKKLKEKGYPQRPDNMSCMPYYEYNEVANYAALCNEIVWYRVDETRDNIFAAPAIHKVLKWLREEKKVFVEIVITPMGLYKPMIYDIEGFKKPYRDISPRINFNEAALAGIEYVIDNLI